MDVEEQAGITGLGGYGYGYGYGVGRGYVGYRFDTVDLDVTSAEVDGKAVEVSECSIINL